MGTLGFGAALVATFAPLRPYFLVLSAALLALGFYFVCRKPKAAEACAGETCAPQSHTRHMAKPLLWLATVVVVALASFPLYGSKLAGLTAPKARATAVAHQTIELRISGMSCEACAGIVQRKLLETSGVVNAEVDYASARAKIQYDPSAANPDTLIAAVNSTGYQASLASPDRR